MLNAVHGFLHATTVPPRVTRIAAGQSTGRVHPADEQPRLLNGSLVTVPKTLIHIGRFAPSTMLTS